MARANKMPADPIATSPDQLPSLAPLYEGTPTRYTPPKCSYFDPDSWEYDSEKKRCAREMVPHTPHCRHDESYHHPGTPWKPKGVSDTGPFGLRRDKKTGAWKWPRYAKTSKNPVAIPERTRENIAACAAIGLSYWSESNSVNELWAVDDHQNARLVTIHRKLKMAHCGDKSASYAVPGTDQLLLGDDTSVSKCHDTEPTEHPADKLREVLTSSPQVMVGHIGPSGSNPFHKDPEPQSPREDPSQVAGDMTLAQSYAFVRSGQLRSIPRPVLAALLTDASVAVFHDDIYDEINRRDNYLAADAALAANREETA